MRRTLYCWGVIPCGSITMARLRFMASAVRKSPSVACCSRERKVSGRRHDSESINDSHVEQANGDARGSFGVDRDFLAHSRVFIGVE
jgi:hypothetical protein